MKITKTPLIAGGVLILVVLIGALVASLVAEESKPPPPPPPPVSARAVVLPANRSRTVVVPPCNTPVSATARNAARGRSTPGATTVELPQGRGSSTLLVPNCQPMKTGSTTVDGGTPSAVFVLGVRRRLSKDRLGRIESDGVIADSQLLLPDGSSTSTIVVPLCTKMLASKSVTVLGAGNSALAVGPSC